jgi:hypothetical protein
MAPVTFDLGPARSRSAAYRFHPFAGGQQTMSILLDTLRICRPTRVLSKTRRGVAWFRGRDRAGSIVFHRGKCLPVGSSAAEYLAQQPEIKSRVLNRLEDVSCCKSVPPGEFPAKTTFAAGACSKRLLSFHKRESEKLFVSDA